jgi:murein DD-endopeptidase MepM/ murein hydrolase activator NlpD
MAVPSLVDEGGQQGMHAGVDVVADGAYDLDRLVVGVGELPVEVALAGQDRAGVAGGTVTRYCHLLTRPALTEGQQLAAGDVIGVSGSSGNSSGPHLHFEVHLGGHDPASAVDPVPFMASAGAPVGQSGR